MSNILTSHSSQRTKLITYSRVMGYIVPVERFNIGKKGEHCERKYFSESNSIR